MIALFSGLMRTGPSWIMLAKSAVYLGKHQKQNKIQNLTFINNKIFNLIFRTFSLLLNCFFLSMPNSHFCTEQLIYISAHLSSERAQIYQLLGTQI